MPAKINTIIPVRSSELVRDRIAQILALELANQAELMDDESIACPVYVERWIPVNVSECQTTSIVIVSIEDLEKQNQTVIDSDVMLTFSIQVFTAREATDENESDIESSLKNQRLAGIIDGILSHQYYISNTLDFPKPFVMVMGVQSIKYGISNREESAGLSVANITYNVKVAQNEAVATGLEWTETTVVQKINDTNKGFKYIFSVD